jgi:two-component system sensor histidine kinase UhpB
MLLCGAIAGCSAVALEPNSTRGGSGRDLSDAGPQTLDSRSVAIAFVGLSALLGVLLLLVPGRAVAATRKAVEESMRRRAVAFQEEDRRRIARELHDGAGQALTAAHLQLEALRATGSDPARVDLVLSFVEEAIDEIRRSTAALSPPALAELGLGPALARHCEVFAGATNLVVEHDLPPFLPPLAAEVEITCYRIVQEALHNVVQHAGANRAWVRVAAGEGTLSLEVEDNGVGLGAKEEEAVDLRSIRERASLIEASVTLSRGRQAGFQVRVEVPLGREEGRS